MTACPSSGGLVADRRRSACAVLGATLLVAVHVVAVGVPDALAQGRGPIVLGPPIPLGPPAPGSDRQQQAPPLFAPAPADAAPAPTVPPSVPPTAPPARTTADGAIRIEGLSRPTLDAAGTLTPDSGGLRADMWQGTPGPIALRLLALLPSAPDSPGMRDLQLRLLLTSGLAPADLSVEGTLLAARAEQLLAMGALDELGALAQSVTLHDVDPALARPLAERALAVGEDGTACSYHDAVAARADDRFWLRLGVICNLWRGDMAKAELGIRLLGEIGEHDSLLQDLVQGGVGGRPAGATRLTGAGPLHLAAARIAKVPIDPDLETIDSLPVLVALARGIGSAPYAARLAAAEYAERAGAMQTDALIALYGDIAVQAGPADGALRAAEADQTAYARALLWRTADVNGDPAERARVIAKALELAGDGPAWRQTARVFAPLVRRLNIGPSVESLAPEAVRVLIAAGVPAAARPWVEWLRTRADAGSPGARRALRRLWVVARIGGGDLLVPYQEAAIGAWWNHVRETEPEAASSLGGAALSLLDALGAPIGVDAWRGLAALPPTNVYEAPTAAFRRGVAAAADAGRLAEAVVLACAGFGGVPLDAIDPTAVADVVRALRKLGLEDQARRLAGEAAVAYGL